MDIDVAVSPSYRVVVERGILASIAEHIVEDDVVIISNPVVSEYYAMALREALQAHGKRCELMLIPDSETSKSLVEYERLLRAMLQQGFKRNGAILALGGGVVGDLAGFVAASFMRGIAFYQCPTSLLAMVDASVGGKTGINTPEGKNLIGAFWQPKAVFVDPETLKTLPHKTFKEGCVELFKHGLLADGSIIEDFQNHEIHAHMDRAILSDLVYRSIKVKADIVAQDEREGSIRAYLNLGHTLAHALEAASANTLSHGDAVAYGLVFASRLAAQRGWQDTTGICLKFLRWLEPAPLPCQSLSPLLPYISRDKKHSSQSQNWVLLRRLGEAHIVNDLAPDELANAWSFLIDAIS